MDVLARVDAGAFKVRSPIVGVVQRSLGSVNLGPGVEIDDRVPPACVMSPRERGLFPGTVDLVILRALVDGSRHGFGISRILRDRSDGVVDLQDAALYQALHRIERQGWIKAEWGLSEKKRRAKFYELTKPGRRRLEREVSAWQRYSSAVSKILEPGDATGWAQGS